MWSDLSGKPVAFICKFSSRKYSSMWSLWDLDAEKRCRANVNQRTQSTISLCAGSLVFSVLLFLLCTLDPSRQQWLLDSLVPRVGKVSPIGVSSIIHPNAEDRRRTAALRGMGTIYRRGTKAMNELIVGHVSESTSVEDFRLFLRTLHRSGVTARADLAFLYPKNPPPANFIHVIYEEEASFQKLLLLSSFSNSTISPFNLNAFQKAAEEGNNLSVQPALWGWHKGENVSVESAEFAQAAAWGSIVGFDIAELNPDDTLHGFIDQAPLQLRRWACYQMLLGMVRHKFKHVLVVEVSGVLVLRDPFGMLRKKGGLYLSLEDRTWGGVSAENNKDWIGKPREGGRNASEGAGSRQLGGDTKRVNRKRRSKDHVAGLCEKVYGREMWGSLEEAEKNKRLINSDAFLGGIHEIRGLTNAMVIEIVRVAMERRNRLPFVDNVVLSYLLHKSSVLGKRVVGHVHMAENEDSFVHSLAGSRQSRLFFKKGGGGYTMIEGYNKSRSRRRWGDVGSVVHGEVCASTSEGAAYGDCSYNTNNRLRRLERQ